MKKNKCVSCKLTLVTGIVFVITSTNNFPFLWKKKQKQKKTYSKLAVSSDISWFHQTFFGFPRWRHTHTHSPEYIHTYTPPPSLIRTILWGTMPQKIISKSGSKNFVRQQIWLVPVNHTIPVNISFKLVYKQLTSR